MADLLVRGVIPLTILVREGWEPRLSSLLDLLEVTPTIRVATSSLFDSVSDTDHPAGILAVVPIPPAATLPRHTDLVLLVDQIRDPGNMGTLIRSAAAFGASCVLMTRMSVDPYNPKAVRAAMGAHFAVPIGAFDDMWRDAFVRGHIQVVVATGDGHEAPEDIDWCIPSVLVIGNEAKGVSDEIGAMAHLRVSIPMANRIESLNAGMAGSVILAEAARQRRLRGPSIRESSQDKTDATGTDTSAIC